jgi:hypothetical protein
MICALFRKATANDQKFRGMLEMTDPFSNSGSISQAAEFQRGNTMQK